MHPFLQEGRVSRGKKSKETEDFVKLHGKVDIVDYTKSIPVLLSKGLRIGDYEVHQENGFLKIVGVVYGRTVNDHKMIKRTFYEWNKEDFGNANSLQIKSLH